MMSEVNKTKLTRVSLPYAVFGLISLNGIVVRAAPIAKWTVGKNLHYISNYFISKGGIIQECSNGDK